MSKQLALQQTFRDSGTVKGHKVFTFSRTVTVNAGGNQFLACSGFTEDQDGGVGFGHIQYLFQYAAHGLALHDNVGEKLPGFDLAQNFGDLVENMSEYRCPACGETNPLFEGDTESMCEVLGLPLLGRIPFDRNFARTFDKGEPILDGSNPTVEKFQDIAKKIHTLLDYQQVLAGKL